MQIALISVLFVMFGGVAITVQNVFSGEISAKTSPIGSAFIIQLGGAIITGVILLLMKGNQIKGWQNVPWYMLLAGASGIVVITSMVYAIPRIGVSGAVSGQLVAMLTFGALIDHFGWFGVDSVLMTPTKIVGMLVLLVGVVLVVKK